MSVTMAIYIGGRKIVSDTRIIIDDILLWSSNMVALFIYLEYIYKDFRKYRVSFRLNKCDFFKPRVEYIGRDVTNSGNCPAFSKFSMINDWPLPIRGESIFYFIGLMNFYHQYALCRLLVTFHRKTIPLSAWTSELTSLFNKLKVT